MMDAHERLKYENAELSTEGASLRYKLKGLESEVKRLKKELDWYKNQRESF